MIIVAYGGGTNSTAMLIGMRDRGIIPAHITFADTGGERPDTYHHIEIMQAWCKKNGFPKIVTVKRVTRDGVEETLEELSIKNKMLPSIAYGFKKCSHKFKIAPQDKYFNNLPDTKELWKSGEKVVKAIGYDYGEERRATITDDKKYEYWYPLIEWEIDRDDCVEMIKSEGLPQPNKSSCFFCPNSRQTEIRELAVRYPDLMERALKMEANAELTSIKGLGRNYAWKDLAATDDMFPELYNEMPCGCYDG